MSVEPQALDRSALESKARDELVAIASAIGAKPGSRARKGEIVDAILSQAGLSKQPDKKKAEEKAAAKTRIPPKPEKSKSFDLFADAAAEKAVSEAKRSGTYVESAADLSEAPRAEGAPAEASHSGNGSAAQSETRTKERSRSGSERGSEARGGESRKSEGDGRGVDSRGSDNRGIDNRGGEGRSNEGRSNEGRNRNRDGRNNEGRGNEGKNRNRDSVAEPGNRKRRRRGRGGEPEQEYDENQNMDPVPVAGLVDLRDDGYGFLRQKGYLASDEDVYVSVRQVRQFGLRKGDHVTGMGRPAHRSEKNPALL
ncbi:MAG: hypothetical protein ACC652_07095, partial [Acidimicrobiales bacterium]